MCFCMVNDKCTCLDRNSGFLNVWRQEKGGKTKLKFEKKKKKKKVVTGCGSMEKDCEVGFNFVFEIFHFWVLICRLLSLMGRLFMEYFWSYSAGFYIYREGWRVDGGWSWTDGYRRYFLM